MADGVSAFAARRLPSARSTLFHEVFWPRMAPTITSKALSAGHQCCGPHALASLRYMARIMASGPSLGLGLAAGMGCLDILTVTDAQHSSLHLEFGARTSAGAVAQPLPALAYRNLHRHQDAKHRVPGVLWISMA